MKLTTSCPYWWRGRKMLRWHRWSAMAPHISSGSNTATFTVSNANLFLCDVLCKRCLRCGCLNSPMGVVSHEDWQSHLKVSAPPCQSFLFMIRENFIFPEQNHRRPCAPGLCSQQLLSFSLSAFAYHESEWAMYDLLCRISSPFLLWDYTVSLPRTLLIQHHIAVGSNCYSQCIELHPSCSSTLGYVLNCFWIRCILVTLYTVACAIF